MGAYLGHRSNTIGFVVIVVVVVVVDTKVARSRFLGIVASDQHYHDVKMAKKVMILCSNGLDKDHECYKMCFLAGHMPIDHTYMYSITPCAASAHAYR